jgi:hypothetical protein
MEGTWEPETRTMTFEAEAATVQGTMRWRETTTSVDDDTRRFQVVMLGPDGAETVALTTTYRRR